MLMLPGLNINRNIIKITRGGKLSQGEVATHDYLKLVTRVQFALLTRLYLLVRLLRFDWRNVAGDTGLFKQPCCKSAHHKCAVVKAAGAKGDDSYARLWKH